jgi:hypothetical protein
MLTQSPNVQAAWESTCDPELTLGYFRSSGEARKYSREVSGSPS